MEGELGALTFTVLARAVGHVVNDLNQQELANTAWAFSRAGQQNATVFVALAGAFAHHIGNFPPQILTAVRSSFHMQLQ